MNLGSDGYLNVCYFKALFVYKGFQISKRVALLREKRESTF